MRLTGRTRLAAVIGDPVQHSLSPAIMNAAFEARGLDWAFVAFTVAAGRAPDAIAAMRTLGLGGLSVTMPHKAAVAQAVDRCSDTAARLGAVNCVAWDGAELVGHNTDGQGFCASISRELGRPVGGQRYGVIGAGGAARAVVAALGAEGAASIVVVNRSAERARSTVALAPAVARVGSAADLDAVDVVINATPVGMSGADAGTMPTEPEQLREGQVVVDLVYHPVQTPWLQAAAARGLATVDGVGMLVHQGAAAFELWTGEPAPIEVMDAAARAALASAS